MRLVAAARRWWRRRRSQLRQPPPLLDEGADAVDIEVYSSVRRLHRRVTEKRVELEWIRIMI